MFHRLTRMTIIAGLAILSLGAGAAMAERTDISIGMVLEPPHLDPTAGAAAAIDEITYQNIYQGLTRIDANGAVQPGLATSWDISDDAKTYTFHLKTDASFSDGTPFTADDVLFSYKRAMADDSVNAQKQLFAPIASLAAPDPYTVVITLKTPNVNFLFNMGRGDAAIVAPNTADTNKTHPVGTGPFAFVEWDKGSKVVLKARADYAGAPVKLSKATFVFIPDPNTAISAMLAGDIDGFPQFPAAEALDVFKSNPQFKVLVGSTEGEVVLSTNNRRKPFSDLRVRQAMAHAIDRKELIDGAASGYGTPIGSHFAPHSPFYVDETGTYPYDLDAARKLLAEAGYPNGFEATLKLPPPPYARRGGQIIAAQMAKIGIRLKLVNVEWAQWLQDVFTNHDFDLSIVAHVEPNDIDIYAKPDYYFGWSSPAFQELMAQINETTDRSGLAELYKQAQDMLAKQAVNGYLFQLAKVGVWDAGLEGMWPNAPVEGNDLTGVHWVK